MTEPRSRRVEIRPGLELHTVWFGPDPADADETPFVLAHGLASNARQWDGVSVELARLGHPVVAVDQRGHGRSAKPDDGYDLPTVADDLARLVESTGFDRPVVAGQSWGGNVVIELAATADVSLRGVACVDGGMIDLRARFPDWDDAAEMMAPPRSAGTPFAQIETFMRSAHPDWPEVGLAGTLACFEQRHDGTAAPWLTFERHMTVLRGLWDHDPMTRYPTIDVPVMFIPAEGTAHWASDKRASIETAAAEIERVRIEWMIGDHDLHAQHPIEVATLLHDATRDFWR